MDLVELGTVRLKEGLGLTTTMMFVGRLAGTLRDEAPTTDEALLRGVSRVNVCDIM